MDLNAKRDLLYSNLRCAGRLLVATGIDRTETAAAEDRDADDDELVHTSPLKRAGCHAGPAERH